MFTKFSLIDRFASNLPLPEKKPKTARLIARISWIWSLMHERHDSYYISKNKDRTLWILWLSYYDDEEGKKISEPIAAGPVNIKNNFQIELPLNDEAIKPKEVEKYAARKLILAAWNKLVNEYEEDIDENFQVTEEGILNKNDFELIKAEIFTSNQD